MVKELCECGKMAVWLYMPGGKEEHPFYCDDCVSRGCSCNNYSTRKEDYFPEGGIQPKQDECIKWLDDHTWTHIDEQGREYPCCEYEYDEEGFDKID